MTTATLLSALLLASAAEPKPETPPEAVKETLDKYLKAAEARDVKSMTALAGTPWLDRDRKVVTDCDGLGKAVERVAQQLPRAKEKRKVETFSYKKWRDGIEDKDERKVLDEVLGEDGWLVLIDDDGDLFSLRTVLVRVTGGKAVVVGGPLKENQITRRNRIPDVVERQLDKADGFELYSLEPGQQLDKDGKVIEPKDGFHGYRVLGKTEVKLDDRKKLADALRLGVEDNSGAVAGCFIPRHGVRLTDDKKTVELVICFQCLSVQVFVDGKKSDGFLVTHEPQAAFDAVLKAAGVKLPKPAKE
jgi:hypothetical protein